MGPAAARRASIVSPIRVSPKPGCPMSAVTLPGSGVSRSRPNGSTGVATESPTDAIVAATCHPLRFYNPERQHCHSEPHPIEHMFDVKSGNATLEDPDTI